MIRQLTTRPLATLLVIFMTIAGSAQAETVMRRANDLSFGGSESLDPVSANRFYEVNDLIYTTMAVRRRNWRRRGPQTTPQRNGR